MKNPNTTHVRDCVKTSKYHPREWVDISGPAYTKSAAAFTVIILLNLFPRVREEKNKNVSQAVSLW